MLTNHGVLPSVSIQIPTKEKLFMWALIEKEGKEVKSRGNHK